MSTLSQQQLHDEEFYEDKISNLQAELKSYGKDIIQLLNGIYGGHISSTTSNHRSEGGMKYDLKNNPFKMIDFLKQELIELIQQSQENELLYAKYSSDLQYCQHLTMILSNIGKIISNMNLFDIFLTKYQLIQASEMIMKIESDLIELPKQASQFKSNSSQSNHDSDSTSSDHNKNHGKEIMNLIIHGNIYKLLKNEKQILKIRLKTLLRRLLMNEMIQLDYGLIRIHKKIQDYLKCEEKVIEEPIYLKDVFTAAIISLNLEDLLQEIIDLIWKSVLVPLWKEKKIQSPSKSANADSAEFVLASVLRGLEQGDIIADSKSFLHFFDSLLDVLIVCLQL